MDSPDTQSANQIATNVVLLNPKPKPREGLLPLFQLTVLLTINASFEKTATVLQVTDLASDLFKKRLDRAQTHIALSRLEARKLVVVENRLVQPLQYTVTTAGLKITSQTLEVMRRVLINTITDGL